jgi:aminoglycoside phosphotransferase
MEIVKPLKGNSGCKILLMQKGNDLFVRKSSSSVEYNERLKDQFVKQNNFIDSSVFSPKTLSSGMHEDLFYFDMEYIQGESLCEFISNRNPNESVALINKIKKIYKTVNFSEVNRLVNEKISKLKHTSIAYDKILDYCADFDWNSLKISYCHGDLSLENIIIKDKKIYFIDFLDSFVDSMYIDLSKMILDLQFGWSWRFNNNFPFVKNTIILDSIKESLDPTEDSMINRLISLHLLRMLPYCSNNRTKTFIQKSLSTIENSL